ncbi:MAG: xoxJ3 [Rubritepida sp.]|nr:xoxJ3 [Rubritepida sp.]
MSSPFLVSLFATLLLAAAAAHAEAPPFRICAEPDNLPLSHREQGGVEIDAARILAAAMGRPLEVVWGEARAFGFVRANLGTRCDALMGVPAGFGQAATTQPWYRASFVFVARDGQALPRDFDDIGERSIGVPIAGDGLGTPPSIALARRGLLPAMHPFPVTDPMAPLRAVIAGSVDLAVVWGPFGRWMAAREPGLVVADTPPRDGPTPFAFDIAIGVRRGDEPLRDALNAAIVGQRAALDAALAQWHVR